MTDVSDRTDQEKQAAAEKLQAEARKANAEAAKAEAEAEQVALELAELREKEQSRLADDDHKRLYRFFGEVSASSVGKCVKKLVEWHRLDPECGITIVIDSPGGSIIDGFHLFDTILWLRDRGHHVTIIAQGMAASMAGVLLQAADKRVMTRQAALLIHEASFGAVGSFGQIEDQVKFVEMLQDRILTIFAERSNLSKVQIRNRWRRKNWWMLADAALKHGFVDAVE